jgi:hypothetical protein
VIEVEDLLRDYQRIVNIRPGGYLRRLKGLNIVTMRSYTLMRISASPTWIAANIFYARVVSGGDVV